MIHFRGRTTLILSLSSTLSEESVHDSVPRDIFCLFVLSARRSFFLSDGHHRSPRCRLRFLSCRHRRRKGCAHQSRGPTPRNGYPAVDASIQSNYDAPMTSMLGMITLGNAIYNYGRNGQPIAQGAPVSRRFAENSHEMYIQDSWKVKPNFTVTLGRRYSLFSPPWETNGLEVTPTTSLGA
jgi:hypothetical protein